MSKATIPVRVFVVDDDEVSREVLALLLESEGYAVTTADSGDAALLDLTAASLAPDVVLVDMQMAGTAGGQLARRLREVCGDRTTLLAMSGSQPEEEARLGFDGFLLKPFAMEAFGAALAGGIAIGLGTDDDGASVLNEGVYAKLAASMQSAQLEQLYAMCLEDAEKRIERMRSAASSHDDAAYRRDAHAIKGGCGMVGATELQTLASTMEEKGTGVANHVVSLDEFLLACARLRRILVARRES